jgi:hypothetical protein
MAAKLCCELKHELADISILSLATAHVKTHNSVASTNYFDSDMTNSTNTVVHTTSVVIDTDCIGSCKSNYHTITATTALLSKLIAHLFTKRKKDIILELQIKIFFFKEIYK